MCVIDSELLQLATFFLETNLVLRSQFDWQVVAFLLAEGAHPQSCDNSKQTPLHFACGGGPSLLTSVCSVTPSHLTVHPQHCFVSGGFHEVAQLLLSALPAPADVNAQDFKGRTPLHLASQHGHDRCAQLLMSTITVDQYSCHQHLSI